MLYRVMHMQSLRWGGLAASARLLGVVMLKLGAIGSLFAFWLGILPILVEKCDHAFNTPHLAETQSNDASGQHVQQNLLYSHDFMQNKPQPCHSAL